MPANSEYTQKVIDTLLRAAEENLATPARFGNVIQLDEDSGADEVMITADVHGHRKNFNLIKRIADLENHPNRHLVMQEVCHGGPTYPENGGCMSHTLLEDVAKLKTQFPERFHFLLSNHELAELTDYPILKSKRMLNMMFRLGVTQMYGSAGEKVRQAYMEFIRTCPLAVRLPNGTFICHSLPERCDSKPFDKSIFDRPLDLVDYQEHGDVFQLVWGRDYRPENAKAFAKAVNAQILIHGHEPCPQGFSAPNEVQVILDCCGDPASYLILPVKERMSHAEVVKRVKKLG